MEAFLKKFITKDGKEHTHSKIPCPKMNIYGGSYCIQNDDIPDFYKAYNQHVFVEGKQAYLTEKQLEEGQILIDVDFRYAPEVEERQHTKNHVIDLLQCVLDSINKIKDNTKQALSCYIFEKDNVNLTETLTKDGIHIMINLNMDLVCKTLLRNHLLDELPTIWDDLQITNTWEDVLDNAVMQGHSNWQLYGSRKPGHEDYKLKYMFNCEYDTSWTIKEIKITPDWILQNFTKLTARNTDLVIMPLNEVIRTEYDMIIEKRKRKPATKNNVKLLTNISNLKHPCELTSVAEIDEYVDDFMSNLTETEYVIKETHQYTMMLPAEYWGPGSYTKWMKVGWALKNTDNRLFITWLKFSSQSDAFDYSEIAELYDKWNNFDKYNKEGLTLRSIMYWCKMSNETEFKRINANTIQHYVYYSIKHNTDYDLAFVLYQLFKESFVCVNIKENVWYEFINNRWQEIDCGHSLRAKISVDMYEIYYKESMKKLGENKVAAAPGVIPSNFKDEKDDNKCITDTARLLKLTSKKNTIMNESKEIFYDKDFYSKLNTNNYLLGCNNCIIDFENGIHRKGKHDDYISKTTNLEYKPLSYYEQKQANIIKDINKFMSELFPEDELKEYMWQHLASTLLGTNENQTINIYTGTGANGKTILIDLMSKVLGEYKGIVPISLITQKRNNIGGTSSEIYQLIGTRYAVMQEPSITDEINEGILKEITGKDPLQCRELFKTSVTFMPQFKLAVATNVLPKIKAKDDGTWRRFRVVGFKSKFTKNPYGDPLFPREDYPHQFEIDTKLSEKFDIWAPVMLSMLVSYAYKYKGKVHDCASVMSASNKYRQGQNIYLEYINECVVESPTENEDYVTLTTIQDDFRHWCKNHSDTNDKKNIPVIELKELLIKRYGKPTKKGWNKISLVDEDTA